MIFVLKEISFQGKNLLHFQPREFIPGLSQKIKQIPGAFWKPQFGWLIPNNEASVNQLKKLFPSLQVQVETQALTQQQDASPPDKPQIPEIHEEEWIRFQTELMLRRYSYYTVKSYKNFFAKFLHYHKDQDIQDISQEEIKEYLLKNIKEKGWSESTQNQAVNAIKFYFEHILKQDRTFYDLRPKKSRKLPQVLSEKEVQQLLNSVKNLKHKTILALIYSAGLRLSESVNLRLADIHPDRRQMFIKAGKGKKDRYVILSDKILALINT